MSNPSIATKLITLVKGVFGRKEPVSASVPAEEAGESTAAEQTPKTEGRVEESATEDSRVETTTEPAAESTAEPAEKDKVAKDKSAKGESKVSPSESADEKDQKAKESEDPAPATEDVPEKKKEIAEEIAVAEADTTVADEEVLEKVRKEAAPAAEDLAVPTYDELTLPSIRARLRKLTVDQVRDLRSYEVAHQGRPEFVKMYDNRIAKLEAEAD